MELKQDLDIWVIALSQLLIELYGIETKCYYAYFGDSPLLIELYGIETDE